MVPSRRHVRLGVLLLALVGLAVALPTIPGSRTLAAVEWARQAGPLGALAFCTIYVGATVCLLPGVFLTTVAGAVYGAGGGTLLVCPASLAGATLAFAVGRWLARDRVARSFAGDARYAALDTAIAERGTWIVVLLRLSPLLPFNLLNYALGLTAIRTRDYVVASAFGMLPGTLLYTYLGSLWTRLDPSGHRMEEGPWAQGLYWGGLCATVAVVGVIAHVARRALRGTLESNPTALEPSSVTGACPDAST